MSWIGNSLLEVDRPEDRRQCNILYLWAKSKPTYPLTHTHTRAHARTLTANSHKKWPVICAIFRIDHEVYFNTWLELVVDEVLLSVEEFVELFESLVDLVHLFHWDVHVWRASLVIVRQSLEFTLFVKSKKRLRKIYN